MKKISYLIAFLLVATATFGQTRLETLSGEIYEGTIIHDSSDYILLRTKEDSVIKIYRDNDVDGKPRMKTSFPVFGLTAGTPSIMHIVGGFYFDGFGVRASAGYVGKYYGLQVNFLKNLSRSRKFSHNLSFFAGISCEKVEYTYLTFDGDFGGSPSSYIKKNPFGGIAYDINIAGMFFEGGLAFGSGNITNPIFTFQVGYVHEFK